MKYFLSLVVFLCSSTILAYYSPTSKKAVMTFNFAVEAKTTKPISKSQALARIEEQVEFLFGAMGMKEGLRGAPVFEGHKIENVIIMPQGKEKYSYKIPYSFTGTVIVDKKAGSTFKLYLPLRPASVTRARMSGETDPLDLCMPKEESYNPYTFFYWFKPDEKDCELVKNKDYQEVEARLQDIPESNDTAPQYDRLFENGILRMDFLYGFLAHPKIENGRVVDGNAYAYWLVRQYLLKSGYETKTLKPDEDLSFIETRKQHPELFEVLEKQTPKGVIQVRLFLGETKKSLSIGEGTKAFRDAFRDAINSAGFIFYSGHSGYGEAIRLSTLSKQEGHEFHFNKNKYQFVRLASCSSTAHYAEEFLHDKGNVNIDIIGNSLLAVTQYDEALVYIKLMEQFAFKDKKPSFHKILKGFTQPFFVGITN